MTYAFQVNPGRGQSIRSVAQDACKLARAFFGHDDFDLSLDVQGRGTEIKMSASASGVVEVSDG